ncbi:hypothetical protein DFJ74DRAFT_669459 [Hyaloraphidium curvatum]|nr:hypothetical protein DFJ74DRAFT_669459 [Hyaloraphidium curvatum]
MALHICFLRVHVGSIDAWPMLVRRARKHASQQRALPVSPAAMAAFSFNPGTFLLVRIAPPSPSPSPPLLARAWRHDLSHLSGAELAAHLRAGRRAIALCTRPAGDGDSISLAGLHVGSLRHAGEDDECAWEVDAVPGERFSLRCACALPISPLPAILDAAVLRSVSHSLLPSFPAVHSCPAAYSDTDLLSRANGPGVLDPPGTVAVLATTLPLAGTVLEFGELDAEFRSSLCCGVTTVADAERLLSLHVNPPSSVTLESMFDEPAPGEAAYGVFKEVRENPGKPSGRWYAGRKAGEDGGSAFADPKPELVSSPTTVMAAPVQRKVKKRRRREKLEEAGSETDGSAGSFVVSDAAGSSDSDPEAPAEARRARKTELGYLADGFVVDELPQVPRKRRRMEQPSDEESARSDMYSLGSGGGSGSETEVTDAGDGEEGSDADRDFVPRKRSRPMLLQMELR